MTRFIRLAALLLSTLFLASAVAQTNLTFWSWRTEDVAAYEKFIDAFHAENPDINVTFTPYLNTEYNTIMATALQAGGGPDIVHLRAYGGMESLAGAGLLTRLDGKVAALAGFDKGILLGATNRADGGVYGVPFALQTVQVLYNTAMFERLGLSEPTTWAEFLAVGDALKASGVYALANGGKDPWSLETMFGAVAPTFYGCTPFFEEITAGGTNFLDPRFEAGLQRMLDLRPYMADNFMGVAYTDMQTLFAFEQAGMLIGGSYELGNMASLNPDLKIGSFAVPADDAATPSCISYYVDGSYGINAASPHQAEALRFIEFLASQEFGQMFTDTLQQISAVPGTLPTSKPLAEMVDLMNAEGTPYLMLTAFRFGQPSGSTLLQNEMQAAMAGDRTVADVAANIQRGVAEWFVPFQ
ncbi:MAG TPA: extracellular solute-binding protein [Trueperaceae bacterium]|nr:extracellular solute-binding protein [Trueperaceae bacterium]